MEVDEVGTHDRRRFHGVAGELVPTVQQSLDLFLSGKSDGLGLHPRRLTLHLVIIETPQELPKMANNALQRMQKKTELDRIELSFVRPVPLNEGSEELA